MTRRRKQLTSLSTLTLSSVLVLTGCGGEGDGEGVSGAHYATTKASSANGGEGGEGEGAAVLDSASDDVEYIHQLGLIRGHLAAFIELYRAGEFDMAMTHAKHPESEIYTNLLSAFERRQVPGFREDLTVLNETAKNRGDIEAAYLRVKEAISANEPKVSVAAQLLAISAIVRTAADEFDLGVGGDGAVTNLHEYQDAYGFLTAAREILATVQAADPDDADAIALASAQIDQILDTFAGLTAAHTGDKASALYGAASRIEITALGLE